MAHRITNIPSDLLTCPLSQLESAHPKNWRNSPAFAATADIYTYTSVAASDAVVKYYLSWCTEGAKAYVAAISSYIDGGDSRC